MELYGKTLTSELICESSTINDNTNLSIDPLWPKVPRFAHRPAQALDALAFHRSVTIDIKPGERKYPIAREVPTPKLDRRRRLAPQAAERAGLRCVDALASVNKATSG